MATETSETTLGKQVNNLAETIGYAIAQLQKYTNQADKEVMDELITSRNELQAGIDDINSRLGKDFKLTDGGSVGHLKLTVNETDYILAEVPKVRKIPSTPEEATKNPTLSPLRNAIYNYSDGPDLESLTLSSIPNSTLETRIYFVCASDDFKLNIGDTDIINEDYYDLEWDKGTQYCVSILDGKIGVSPCYHYPPKPPKTI